jgi:acetoin utilization protein AcuB
MSPKPITVSLDATLEEIRELLRVHRFHHVLVTSDRRLAGVISDRDVLHRLSPFAGTPAEQRRDVETLRTHAHQVMTRHPITVTAETDVLAAARILVDKRISCLPVVDAELHVLGVVTWKDLLRAVISARDGARAPTS